MAFGYITKLEKKALVTNDIFSDTKLYHFWELYVAFAANLSNFTKTYWSWYWCKSVFCKRFFVHIQHGYHIEKDVEKGGNHPQEDLAKFGYMPSLKYKYLIILLYFCLHTENQVSNSGNSYFFSPHFWWLKTSEIMWLKIIQISLFGKILPVNKCWYKYIGRHYVLMLSNIFVQTSLEIVGGYENWWSWDTKP